MAAKKEHVDYSSIPKETIIGGHTWRTIFKKMNGGNFGKCDPDTLTLSIKEGSPTSKAEETYIHELIHAIEHETKVGLSEDEVERFSKLLYQVLKANNIQFKF